MQPSVKKALVTGGSAGIGLAIARQLKDQGHKVAILSRDPKAEGFDAALCCDVLKPAHIELCIQAIKEMWGGIDILINNVGGGGRWGSRCEVDMFDEWQDVYDKNAGAAIKFTMAFLPYMQAHRWGRVITIASLHGREAGGFPWFNMAKAAEISLMKSLSIRPEYKDITFNTVAPGYINVDGKPIKQGAGKPDDVADLVTFLCGAPYINGACVPVDGGEGRSF